MKKILALILVFAMVLGLMGCMVGKKEPVAEEEPTTVPTTVPPTEPPKKAIHVLVPASLEAQNIELTNMVVNHFDEITVVNYSDVQMQQDMLSEIAAKSPKDGTHAVVTIPASNEMADVFTALTEANVAYALADVIPETASAASVANVHYDQRQIGAAAAAYLVEQGLTQKKKVVILQGMSEEEAERTEGFKLYLQGKMELNGQTIKKAWTSLSNIVYSDMQGETKDSAEKYFDTYMESKDHADTKYFAAWDDAYVLGMMEALEGETITSSIKKTFLKGKPVVASCGNSQAMLDLLAGKSEYSNLKSFGGIQTIHYSQDLLKLAAVSMCDYFAGSVVEQDQTMPIVWITAENASQYQGY